MAVPPIAPNDRAKQAGAETPAPTPQNYAVPSVGRRIAALPYEGLLLLALVLIASFPIAGLRGAALDGTAQIIFQLYLVLVITAYFVWHWQQRGQTLAMKTWRFRVVDRQGRILSWQRALLRVFCAAIFFGPACAGLLLLFFPGRMSPVITMWFFFPLAATVLYGLFDRDQQFLHDRLAGTQLRDAPPPIKR